MGAYKLFGLSGWALTNFLSFQGGHLFKMGAYSKLDSYLFYFILFHFIYSPRHTIIESYSE